jgi:hypothetical protein
MSADSLSTMVAMVVPLILLMWFVLFVARNRGKGNTKPCSQVPTIYKYSLHTGNSTRFGQGSNIGNINHEIQLLSCWVWKCKTPKNRFVLKSSFIKIYTYHFRINIFIKIRSQSYVLETVSLSKTIWIINMERVRPCVISHGKIFALHF